MHLTRRTSLQLLILVAVATSATAGGPAIVFDAGTASSREVFSSGRSGKRVRNRTSGTADSAFLMSASPDGKRVAWFTQVAGGTEGGLFVARARRGRAREVTDGLTGSSRTVAWSPDSRLLVFEHADEGTGRSDVYVTKANGRKRRSLTGGLAGSGTDGGLLFAPDSRFVAASWAFPDRTEVVLLDATGELAPRVVSEQLPDGRPAGGLAFLPDGELPLVFTWLPDGAGLPDLYEGYRGPVRIAVGVRSFSVAGGRLAVLTERLWIRGPEGEREFDPEEDVLAFRLGPDGTAVAILDGRLFRIPVVGPAEEMLADRTLEAIIEVVFVPGGPDVLVRAREGGKTRLFFVTPGREAREPAFGLPGVLGAEVNVSPAGDLVLFRTIDQQTLRGSLFAWAPADGSRRDLTAETGVPGLPGGAKFSPRTGDLLLTTVSAFDATRRLFLWRRTKDRVVPVSPPDITVGSLLFTR